MTKLQILNPTQLQSKIDDGAYVLDIRDANSYTSNHIKGSQRIDNSNIGAFLAEADKDKPVVVCCYQGFSSMQAAEVFINQGFGDVYSLEGGFNTFCTTHPQMCA